MPDLDDTVLERRLRDVLEEHLGALALDLTVETLDRRREARSAARRFGRRRGMTLLAAAALIGGGALAAGSGILRLPSVISPVPAPTLVAIATASPDAPSPSSSMWASTVPTSPVPPTITWTEGSLTEDWPAPARAEVSGPPIVVPMFMKVAVNGTKCPANCSISTQVGDPLMDPAGDIGSADQRWADIKEVSICGPACLSIRLSAEPPAGVDPSQLWIAYGVVEDTDGDGVPDRRYGVDNVPIDKTDSQPDRWWRTDLHTGRTDSAVGDHLNLRPSGTIFWGSWPSEKLGLKFGAETAGVGQVGGLPKRFYVWASVIQHGQVVATDYAPDFGWLVPSATAKP